MVGEDTVRELAQQLACTANTSAREWCESAGAAVRAVASTRLSREHAIAESLTDAGVRAFQPGLFDTRAARAHDAQMDERSQVQGEAARRIAIVESSTTIASTSTDLLLVVLP